MAKFKKPRKTKLKKTTVRIMSGNDVLVAIRIPADRALAIPWSLRNCPSLGRITGCYTCEPAPGFTDVMKRGR